VPAWGGWAESSPSRGFGAGQEGHGGHGPPAPGPRGVGWWQLSQAAAHPGRARRRPTLRWARSFPPPRPKALPSSGARWHGGDGCGAGTEQGHKAGKPQPPGCGQGGGPCSDLLDVLLAPSWPTRVPQQR